MLYTGQHEIETSIAVSILVSVYEERRRELWMSVLSKYIVVTRIL